MAVDISEGMMSIGRRKVKAGGLDDIITFEKQDCAEMNFPDNSFDASTIAFGGVRNFEDIDKSFKEVLRVLKPGGGYFYLLNLQHPAKHR